MDAILCADRTGISWRYQRHDFVPWETADGCFAAWQKDGLFDQLNGLVGRPVRQAAGRDAEPGACVLDARSIKTSANGPAADGVRALARALDRLRASPAAAGGRSRLAARFR
jgi:transposase